MSRRRRGGRLCPEPAAGRQCRNDPVRGDVRCVSHGGRRPDLGPDEPDALEEKLRREEGDRLMAEFSERSQRPRSTLFGVAAEHLAGVESIGAIFFRDPSTPGREER